MRSLAVPAVAVLASAFACARAFAQCAFTAAAMQPAGQGCNPLFAVPPNVTVALDPTACTVLVTVNAFQGCCNTFLAGRVLVLGLQPVSIPVPQLGAGCTLLADPVVLLYQTATAGPAFALALPPLAPPLTFHAQGAAHYFTTLGLSHDFALTHGGQVTVQ